MRITEILISLIIFSLISICFMYSLLIFNKTEVKTRTGMKDCIEILETDEKIRNEIRKIRVPYWENTDNFCELYISEAKQKIVIGEAEIIDIVPLKINGRNEGLKVTWIYKGNEIKTEERFSSREIF